MQGEKKGGRGELVRPAGGPEKTPNGALSRVEKTSNYGPPYLLRQLLPTVSEKKNQGFAAEQAKWEGKTDTNPSRGSATDKAGGRGKKG